MTPIDEQIERCGRHYYEPDKYDPLLVMDTLNELFAIKFGLKRPEPERENAA